MSTKKIQRATIGDRVKFIREEAGMTRDQFCLKTGIKKRTLVGIESEGRDPQGSTLEKIASAFPKEARFLLLGHKVT